MFFGVGVGTNVVSSIELGIGTPILKSSGQSQDSCVKNWQIWIVLSPDSGMFVMMQEEV